jgi:uncharacterized protein
VTLPRFSCWAEEKSRSSSPRRPLTRVRRHLARAYRCAYTTNVVYAWDEEKNRSNLRKHGIDFADAVLALEDGNAMTIDDDVDDEERFVTLGTDALNRLLVVVYTWRGQDIRVISARKATRRERSAYEGGR